MQWSIITESGTATRHLRLRERTNCSFSRCLKEKDNCTFPPPSDWSYLHHSGTTSCLKAAIYLRNSCIDWIWQSVSKTISDTKIIYLQNFNVFPLNVLPMTRFQIREQNSHFWFKLQWFKLAIRLQDTCGQPPSHNFDIKDVTIRLNVVGPSR